jgi:hypothetical protein
MTRSKKLLAPALLAALGIGAALGSFATAEPAQESKAASAETKEMKLPPGWTEDDVKAMVMAGTPGKMQERLTKGAGTWIGKNTLWMGPDAEPMNADTTTKVTPIMDGRYIKVEVSGEMPGMGPFSGLGIYGYDNVAGKYVATWVDSQSTGIMNGTGELSPDGKTLTWTHKHTCPITKKPTVVREVHTETGPNTATIEMWGTEPKSGKEFKMMRIELTKK